MKQLSSKQRKGMSCSEAGKLGAIASASYQKRKRQSNITLYNKSPIKCKNCKFIISYDKRTNKFCSRSCAASFNNLGNRKHGNGPNKCKQCDKLTSRASDIYCSNRCHADYKFQEKYNQMLKSGTADEFCQQSIRNVLLFIHGNKCEICGITKWYDNLVPVVIDHIDGKANNNKLNNLRIICCNCDALLPTYKGRNAGNGTRQDRRKRYAAGKTY